MGGQAAGQAAPGNTSPEWLGRHRGVNKGKSQEEVHFDMWTRGWPMPGYTPPQHLVNQAKEAGNPYEFDSRQTTEAELRSKDNTYRGGGGGGGGGGDGDGNKSGGDLELGIPDTGGGGGGGGGGYLPYGPNEVGNGPFGWATPDGGVYNPYGNAYGNQGQQTGLAALFDGGQDTFQAMPAIRTMDPSKQQGGSWLDFFGGGQDGQLEVSHNLPSSAPPTAPMPGMHMRSGYGNPATDSLMIDGGPINPDITGGGGGSGAGTPPAPPPGGGGAPGNPGGPPNNPPDIFMPPPSGGGGTPGLDINGGGGPSGPALPGGGIQVDPNDPIVGQPPAQPPIQGQPQPQPPMGPPGGGMPPPNPNDPFGPTSAMDVYRSMAPVMGDVLTDNINSAMTQAGFGGNRFSSYAMNEAAKEGSRAGRQLTSDMSKLLYDQTNRDLTNALTANDQALRGEGLMHNINMDKLGLNFDMGKWETGRQDMLTRLGIDQFNQDKFGWLPMMMQLAQNPGVGGTSPTFANNTTAATPGIWDYFNTFAQYF